MVQFFSHVAAAAAALAVVSSQNSIRADSLALNRVCREALGPNMAFVVPLQAHKSCVRRMLFCWLCYQCHGVARFPLPLRSRLCVYIYFCRLCLGSVSVVR